MHDSVKKQILHYLRLKKTHINEIKNKWQIKYVNIKYTCPSKLHRLNGKKVIEIPVQRTYKLNFSLIYDLPCLHRTRKLFINQIIKFKCALNTLWSIHKNWQYMFISSSPNSWILWLFFNNCKTHAYFTLF